jgi:hypothetical protein
MNKAKLQYILDAGLAVTFFTTLITGLLKWPGMARAMGISLTPRISIVHEWSGIIMAALVFVHLILHYEWIVCMTKAIFKKKDEKCDPE